MYNIIRKINSKGFTLIEIIASIAILGVVVAILLPIFPQIMSWTQTTDDELVASNLLDQITYDLETAFVGEIGDCSTRVDNAINITEANTYHEQTYSSTFHVSQDDQEKDLGLYRIHVQIYQVDHPESIISDTYMYLSCKGDDNETL